MSLSKLMMSSAAVLVAAVATVAGPSPAARAYSESPAWATGEALSSPGVLPWSLSAAQLPDGRRALAWAEDVPLADERVFVRVETVAGGFGTEQSFRAPTRDLRLIAGAHGTLALVWSAFENGVSAVHVALRAPEGGPLSEVTPLTVPGRGIRGLDAAFLDDGAGHDVPYLTYVGSSATVDSAWAARVAPGATALAVVPGASGGALESVAHPGGGAADAFLDQPHVAAAADGLEIAYTRGVQGGGQASSRSVVVARATAGGAAFGAPSPLETRTSPAGTLPVFVNLATAGGPIGPQVAWAFYGEDEIRLQRQGTTARVATGLPQSSDLRLAVDAAGAATLAWITYKGNNYGVWAARVPVGGAPSPSQPLTGPGLSQELRALAVGPDGTALVVYGDDEDDSDEALEARLASPGGAFGPAEALPGPHESSYRYSVEEDVAALVLPGGRPFVHWIAADADDPDGQRVRVARRDVAPPSIARAEGPATTTVGARVAFAGAAADDLTGVVLRWDFGDGASADGAAVTHAFTAPGTKTVVLTATDGAGHAVSRALTVNVAPRPEGGGPGMPPGAVPDRAAPVLKGLSLSRATFRAGGGATAIAAKAKAKQKTKATPRGTTIRITSLSERATLVITFTRRVNGRTRTEGTLVRTARGPGAVSIPFSGRIGKAALPAGTYTMSVVAVDAAGNRTNKAATAKLTVAAR